jgi:hypothetical protein
MQNLVQAGVGGGNREVAAVPGDGGRLSFVIGRPIGRRWCCRLNGSCGGCERRGLLYRVLLGMGTVGRGLSRSWRIGRLRGERQGQEGAERECGQAHASWDPAYRDSQSLSA